jgi:hypothetical protein
VGNFVTWGIIGALAAIAVSAGIVAWWFDPSRQVRKTKRRAASNQAWVRDKCRQNGIMDLDAEAKLVLQARKELEDPWKHLSR